MTNKNASAKVTQIKKPDYEDTKAFTFEVTVLLQVLSPDEAKAREQLEAQGGYVTSRKVKLVNEVKLFNGADKA